MHRLSDWSTFLSYLTATALTLSDNIVKMMDEHAAGIGALCQIIGVCVVLATYFWNKSCQLRRLKYYEEHFAECLRQSTITTEESDEHKN